MFQQLLLKFHLCTNDSDIEVRFAELSSDFYKAAEDKMKVVKKTIYLLQIKKDGKPLIRPLISYMTLVICSL